MHSSKMKSFVQILGPVLLLTFFRGFSAGNAAITVKAEDSKVLEGKASLALPASRNSAAPQSAAAQPALTSTQASAVLITPDERKKLPVEFKKALNDEERATEHQEKAQIKELTASQSAALKNWRLQEKNTRRAFFEQHSGGPERRQFVHEYITRKKTFDQSQKDDLVSAKRGWKEKREQLKQFQKERELKFKTAIEQNHRPDPGLWPQAH